eukprot:TRINITY_DN2914_c2_g1_i1.p1 TRINITY_DN2914_c2_g1~~TRINITY_DN2914_c2_g1_i1.p1  ORF type:complete len:507 (-),score=77.65 TRINITY_DN2914_c2_g1_i1:64-1533(-)
MADARPACLLLFTIFTCSFAASGLPTCDHSALLHVRGHNCTRSGEDPWATGQNVPCCHGLLEQLGMFGQPQMSYRCALPPLDSLEYHPHFDTTPDYLDIGSRVKGVGDAGGSLADNFYVVLGDSGGCAGGCPQCCEMQRDVAKLLQDYVAERKRQKKHSELLFVLLVGDNFYWTGAHHGRFKDTWKEVYGEVLTSVPWFAVMGNHDYGDSDPGSGCPHKSPRFTCDASNAASEACGGPRPYSKHPQGYDSNQLNANKGGVDGALRKNYHMPDYTYYYTIPALSFELLAMDWNYYKAETFGGGGAQQGARYLNEHCGGFENLKLSMKSIEEASTKLLLERAVANKSSNVAIFSHYPDEFQNGINLRRTFLDKHPSTPKVFNFFGHTHSQGCKGWSDETKTECVDFLTGGSGGCCSLWDQPAGFVVVSFDDKSKAQRQECFAPNPWCTTSFRHGILNETSKNDTLAEDVCPWTRDEPACPTYLGPTSSVAS